MIYECSGLPGSGKSTLVQELSNQLGSKKIKQVGTDSFWAVKSNSRIMKITIKIYRVLQLLKPTNWRFVFIGLRFFFGKAKVDDDSTDYSSSYETFIALLYCVYLFDEYKKNTDIIISDEGFLQALTSFSLKRDSGLEKINSLVYMQRYIKTPILHIYCKLSIDETINRLSLRNRKTSTFDEIPDTVLPNYLYRHKARMELLIAKDTFSGKIEVDMNKPTKEIIQQIIKAGEEVD